MTRTLKILVAIGTAASLVAGYAMVRERRAPAGPAGPAVAQVAEFLENDLYTVQPGALERALPITGSLVPFTEATVKAKVAGELMAVAVREGEAVKQGQMLARIDLTEVEARVAAAQADVEAARAQLVWASKNREQQKALLDKSFISQSAFDNVQSNHDVAAAKLRAAEADLVVAKKALGDAVLVAPFSGVVAQRHAQPGERVALDAKVISIVDLSRLELEASVPPAAIGEVKVGQPVSFRVEGFGERAFEGRIERINPAATAGSRSISVYAVIDNRDGVLRGGMFAQGALTLARTEGALSVPATAVREEIGQTFVYAIADGVVKRRNVKVGPPDTSGRVQVLEGLAAGDRIVRVNLGALREGLAARIGAAAKPVEAASSK